MNSHMAACFIPDCPRTTRVSFLGSYGIILPLAVGLSNGMNRGEIQNVKPRFAISGRIFSQSKKVPCWFISGEQERGKSSYQAPNKAFFRSTITFNSLG